MQRLVLPSSTAAAANARSVFFFLLKSLSTNGVGPPASQQVLCTRSTTLPINLNRIDRFTNRPTAIPTPPHSRGGARWRLLRLRAALSTLPYSRTAVAASASTTTSSINGGQRRRRPLPLCPPRAALGTKAGGDGGPPHPELFLAELFGGVVNKPREGTVGNGSSHLQVCNTQRYLHTSFKNTQKTHIIHTR